MLGPKSGLGDDFKTLKITFDKMNITKSKSHLSANHISHSVQFSLLHSMSYLMSQKHKGLSHYNQTMMCEICILSLSSLYYQKVLCCLHLVSISFNMEEDK